MSSQDNMSEEKSKAGLDKDVDEMLDDLLESKDLTEQQKEERKSILKEALAKKARAEKQSEHNEEEKPRSLQSILGFGNSDEDDASEEARMEREKMRVSAMLPTGSVAPLFESETCLLCKGEHPNPREYYALTDMGHEEPKGQKTSAFGLRVKTKVGSMVPLQIAACNHCRKNHMVASYLKLFIVLALMALALVVLALPPVNQALSGVHEALPLVVFILMLPLSFLIGWGATNAYLKKHCQNTRLNIEEIPFVAQMMAMGWFPLYESEKVSRLVFSKSRLKNGWFI